MTSSKRGHRVFDAVSALESQDAVVAKKRHKASEQDLQQSKAAQSQQAIYNSLLETRILLERSIQAASKEVETEKAVEKCNLLLVHLLKARQMLMRPDEEENDNDFKDIVNDEDSSKLKEQLQSDYSEYEKQWEEVLNRRHKNVRLHSGNTAKSQFRVVDASFWQQVEATVQYEESRRDDDDMKFDDTKVYQQLLKDFVTSHQASATAADRAIRPKAQNVKKQVDRKASKGRKIRYNVIPKLVNFTFPLSRPQTTNDLDEDAWFSSLFGGVVNRN